VVWYEQIVQMSQSQDLAAIDTFIHSVSLNTNDAKALFTDWVQWYTNLGWYDLNVNSATYDTARNKRNAFELANAESEADKEQIRQVQTQGISTEQAQGLPDRRDADGNIVPPPKTPFWQSLSLIQKGLLGTAGFFTGVILLRKIK